MQSGTAQSVDTINRTGENLARVYGEMPRAIGEGVRGTVQAYKKAEKEAYDRTLSEEDRARVKESFEIDKKLKGLQTSAAERADREAKADEDWLNSPHMAPGVMSSYVEPWNSPNKRTAMKQAGFDELLATPGRNTKKFDLDLKLSEEQIAAARAQRAAAAAAIARGNQMDDLNIKQIKRTDLIGQFKGALMTGDTDLLPKITSAALAANFTAEQINAMKAEAQAGFNSARAEKEITDAQITTEGQALTAKIGDLDKKILGLGRVGQKLGQWKAANSTPFLTSGTSEGNETFKNLRSELASFNPEAAANLNRVGDFDVSRGLAGNGYFEGAKEGVEKLTNRVVAEAEAELAQIEVEAVRFNNQRILAQIAGKKEQLKNIRNLITVGADPSTHNSDPLTPMQQQPQRGFFDPKDDGVKMPANFNRDDQDFRR
jgi:hypothetical protein